MSATGPLFISGCEGRCEWVEGVVHLVELRGSAASNLLCAQLHQLGLQVIELLLELVLVLAPKRRGLDFSGGLHPGVLSAASLSVRIIS